MSSRSTSNSSVIATTSYFIIRHVLENKGVRLTMSRLVINLSLSMFMTTLTQSGWEEETCRPTVAGYSPDETFGTHLLGGNIFKSAWHLSSRIQVKLSQSSLRKIKYVLQQFTRCYAQSHANVLFLTKTGVLTRVSLS